MKATSARTSSNRTDDKPGRSPCRSAPLARSRNSSDLELNLRHWVHVAVLLVDDAHVVDGYPLMLVPSTRLVDVAADNQLRPDALDRVEQFVAADVFEAACV